MSVVLKVDSEKISKVTNMMEFYEVIGAKPYFESKQVTDVSKIKMNSDDNEKLNDLLKTNANKKYKRRYSKKYIDTAVAMDWLNYSPVSVKDMEHDVVLLEF